MSASTIMTYTLFRRGSRRTEKSNSGVLLFNYGPNPEVWQSDQTVVIGGDRETPKDALEFVCHVKSPQEVAAAVRKAPLDEYVLFRGEMMAVKVAIPVFVDGKNLETLSAEWDVQNAE